MAVADVGLGVDDEPGLAGAREDVVGVQIGEQQGLAGGELDEQLLAEPYQGGVESGVGHAVTHIAHIARGAERSATGHHIRRKVAATISSCSSSGQVLSDRPGRQRSSSISTVSPSTRDS